MDNKNHDQMEYTEPMVTDYGSLEDLTAQNGSGFVDLPKGTPVGPGTSITGSTP